MALTVRSIERRLGAHLTFRAAADGELGLRAALRERPEIVVADEIASRAGAFALAKSLRDDADPFTGVDRRSCSIATTMPGSRSGQAPMPGT